MKKYLQIVTILVVLSSVALACTEENVTPKADRPDVARAERD